MERTSRGRDGDGTDRRGASRRDLLRAGAGAAAAGALSGCLGLFNGGGTPAGPVSLQDFRGSGAQVGARPELEGPRIEDLPPLEGKLNIYIGGGESGLYLKLVNLLKRIYPDFKPGTPRTAGAAQLANTIIEAHEGGGSRADVFWAIDAGSLAAVADAGATRKLPSDVVEKVPETFRPNRQWVGVAGRARAVPFNTDRLSKSAVPTDIYAFPDDSRFAGAMGWAPTYSAFQAFVTAMRLTAGRSRTKSWLEAMKSAGTSEYSNEFLVSQAVADGEITAGLANHYYALRVQAARSSAPIDLAFTQNDPGALVNTAAAGVISDTGRGTTAERFIQHLLTVEAQEFFATRTFAYPMLPGVPPVGGLPPINQLQPPDLDLAKLSDVQPTLDLLREVGLL